MPVSPSHVARILKAKRASAVLAVGESVRAARSLARAHPVLVAMLAGGGTIRVLAMVAYSPALFFSDSWGYLATAFAGHPIALSYLRPNGYPVLIGLLTLPGRNVTRLIAFQHVSGLATGTLVYALLAGRASLSFSLLPQLRLYFSMGTPLPSSSM